MEVRSSVDICRKNNTIDIKVQSTGIFFVFGGWYSEFRNETTDYTDLHGFFNRELNELSRIVNVTYPEPETKKT